MSQPVPLEPSLSQIIAARIAETPEQRIPFATFMDWALYEPGLGYYAAYRQKIGAGGDFVTSPHLGADFGELLAEQFLDLWQSLQCPNPFQIVEMGAGQGLIAKDVLRYLQTQSHIAQPYRDFWAALHYVILEKNTAFIAEQRLLLQPWLQPTPKLTWTTWADLPDQSVTGCFFSNELVDAFPVHRIEIQDGQLQEVYVAVAGAIAPAASDPPQFVEQVAPPSTPALTSYLEPFQLNWAAYPNGYRSEVNLAALDWLQTVAKKLARGYLLTLDYGYAAAQYYSPQRRQGTLQCYTQHAHHNEPYWHVGQQDITAHVNFTALEHYGARYGLEPRGFDKQALFLMALGLGDRLSRNAASATELMTILQRREALHALINPLGLGGFGVLLQGTATTPTLDQYPFKGFAT